MKCRRCGNELLKGAFFCTVCGTNTDNKVNVGMCSKCGYTYRIGEKYCMRCGVALHEPTAIHVNNGTTFIPSETMDSEIQKVKNQASESTINMGVDESTVEKVEKRNSDILINNETTDYRTQQEHTEVEETVNSCNIETTDSESRTVTHFDKAENENEEKSENEQTDIKKCFLAEIYQ